LLGGEQVPFLVVVAMRVVLGAVGAVLRAEAHAGEVLSIITK